MTVGDQIERAAWRDLVDGAPPALRDTLRLTADEIADALVLRCENIDHPLLNRTIGLGTTVPATESEVRRIVEHYRDAGLERFWVHLNQEAKPDSLRRWLEQEGLHEYRRPWVRLVRDDTTPPRGPASSLVVARATNAAAVGRLLAEGFDLPPTAGPLLAAPVGRPGWHHYAALDGLAPVAASALYVRGRSGYLAMAATSPSHRQRGAQSALIVKRVQVALALGCTRIVSETGEAIPGVPNPSHDNLLRLGFRRAHVRPNYAPAKGAWDHGRGAA